MLKISSSVTSNTGKNLRINEDNFYMNGVFLSEENSGGNGAVFSDSNNRRIQFYAVFDGIGNDVKSSLSPNTEFTYGQYSAYLPASLLSKLQKFLKTKQEYNLDSLIHAFAKNANREICNHMKMTNSRSGASFALLCLERRGTIRAYNIGNSKIFMLRDNRIIQLSQDDTLVENLIAEKQINADIARHSPENKILTQHLGMFEHEKDINMHINNRYTLRNGDKFLLCTDALCDYLTSSRIYQILSRDISEQEIVNDFIIEAMQNIGDNNLTVIVVGVNQVEDTGSKKILLQPEENEVTNFTPLRYKKAFAIRPKHLKQIAYISLAIVLFIVIMAFVTSSNGPLKAFFGKNNTDEPTSGTPPGTSDVTTTAETTNAPATTEEPDDLSGFVPPETRSEDDYTEGTTVAPPAQTNPPATQPPVTQPPVTQAPTTAPMTEPPATTTAEEQTTEMPTEEQTTEPVTETRTEPPAESEESESPPPETDPVTEPPVTDPETEEGTIIPIEETLPPEPTIAAE